MAKLTDTQLIILATAARRADGSILPLPKKLKLGADSTEAALKGLIKKKLATEEPATVGSPRWREATDGQAMTLKITASGLQAIGAQEPEEGADKSSPSRSAGKTKGRKSSANRAGKVQPGRSSKSAEGRTGSSGEVRDGSKLAKLIDLLRQAEGASLAEMQKATGWQSHSVRGVMSGALKKKLGLGISSAKDDSGERRYRIAE